MLMDLGQKEVRLLTNNPEKIRAVEGPNREIVVKERVAMVPLSWKGRGGFKSEEVEGYLKAKVSADITLNASILKRYPEHMLTIVQIEKMGHMLEMGGMSS
jgi:GTP cyclohydrolase II